MFSFKNYSSVLNFAGRSDSKWCLSTSPCEKPRQAEIEFSNGTRFKCVSFLSVKEGEAAIVGNRWNCCLPVIEMSNIADSETGKFGVITETIPVIEIRKSSAYELEYVFSQKVTTDMLRSCAHCLYAPGDSASMQREKATRYIYPISFYTRKILAAASIISFSEHIGRADMIMAKKFILSPHFITDEMSCLTRGFPEYCDIGLCDVQINAEKHIKNEQQSMNISYLSDGCLDGWEREMKTEPVVNEYVDKYANIGAVSIMIRGGFENLLEAYLSANPPISDYFEEMLGVLPLRPESVTSEMIKTYEPKN